ncbi:MAG: recombination-associated protein RdgC [Candidatus Marinimicrobia bacterium]|nr:recombination-associated protein RdgC [Candidatus Neomarinimicrobiota bacterium]
MWFKNLRLYLLTKPFTLSAEALHDQLATKEFHPCGNISPFSYGWVSPLGKHGELLTHAANGYIMLCAQREEKVLPASVVREYVTEKVTAIEEEQARTVRRKERDQIKDEVLLDLLPRAFSRSTRTFAYLAPKDGWLVVDAASASQAEDLVSLLRESLGGLSAVLPSVNNSPAQALTQWLSNQAAPTGFVIEDQCELRDPKQEGGVVRCTRQDLAAEEVMSHLTAGKQVAKLALEWNERLSCILADDLTIQRLRFLDVIQEAAQEVEADDEAGLFDADFALMTLELARFIPALLEVFGGESKSNWGMVSNEVTS